MKQLILLCMSLLTAVVVFIKSYCPCTGMSETMLANVEALAQTEGVYVSCLGEGNVQCPDGSMFLSKRHSSTLVK